MGWPLKRSQWRKKSTGSKHCFIFLFLALTTLLLFLFLSCFASFSQNFLLPKTLSRSQSITSQCGPKTSVGAELLADERFIWYAPHSGFSNQLSELKNAIIFAAILNRTLIIPPVLDHHAVALGSCPKFRVTRPSDLRAAVWDHVMDLVRHRRYISMADIVDLSSVSPKTLKIIDFRIFASLWCGLNMDGSCHGNLCCAMSSLGSASTNLHYCSSLLSGSYGNPKVPNQCFHAVEEDCRTTVWTYQQPNAGTLDSFQHDEQLQKRKKISYVRRRRDLYEAFGPGSEAGIAKVLAFGSLFTSPYRGSELYIDIHEAPRDSRIQSLLEVIEFLPFAPELIAAGKEIAQSRIKEPFLCAQLRLLDGQFKNHWKATFSALKEKLQSLRTDQPEKKDVHIFIMTDLPNSNWTGTYLEDMETDAESYKLYTLDENDELVRQAAERLAAAEHGFRFGFLPRNIGTASKNGGCSPALSPDILLYVEEVVCSCASVGFVGTAGSTIAESIALMRKKNICKL